MSSSPQRSDASIPKDRGDPLIHASDHLRPLVVPGGTPVATPRSILVTKDQKRSDRRVTPNDANADARTVTYAHDNGAASMSDVLLDVRDKDGRNLPLSSSSSDLNSPPLQRALSECEPEVHDREDSKARQQPPQYSLDDAHESAIMRTQSSLSAPQSVSEVLQRHSSTRNLVDQAHLIDPLLTTRRTASVPSERSATAVIMKNQTPRAGTNPLTSSTTASSIASRVMSDTVPRTNSTRHGRSLSDSESESGAYSDNESSVTTARTCCGSWRNDLRDATRATATYARSFDPWLAFIVVLCTLTAILLYLFNCRDISNTNSGGCVDFLWGNYLWQWFAMIAIVIAAYQAATVTEKLLLGLLSCTAGTALWRVWLYGSQIETSGRFLAYFGALLACRQQNVFSLASNVGDIVDPALGILVVAFTLGIVKKMILKHIVWKMNQKAFDAKIEQLFFVVDFITIISDPSNHGRGYMYQSSQAQSQSQPRQRRSSGNQQPGSANPSQSTSEQHKPASHKANFPHILSTVKNWTLGQTEAREVLRSQKIAREAARPLWRNLDRDQRGFVTLQEFQAYFPIDKAARAFYTCLPNEKRAEVHEKAGFHEHDGDVVDEESAQLGDSALFPRTALPFSSRSAPPSALNSFILTKQEFYQSMQQFAADRRKLALELTDWSNMSDILDSLATIIWFLACIFIFVAMYSSFSAASLTPITSFVLAFSFIFGNSAKQLLESIVFILVAKPFSLGDRIYVPSHPTSDLIVHNIALLTTTFKEALSNKLVSIPNSLLSNQELQNLTRSKLPAFEIPIDVKLDTSSEQLGVLQQAVVDFINSPPQRGLWVDKVSLNILRDSMNLTDKRLRLILRVTHSRSWTEINAVQTSLRAMIQQVAAVTKDLGIRP